MPGFPVLLAAFLVAPAFAGLRRQQPLSPALSPEDHDKFFDHDYPDDQRPSPTKAFNFQHPFPVVQDSEDYDKDYVKDENRDGGQWQAQQKYDALHNKLQSSNEAMGKAKALEQEELKKLEELKAKEKAVEGAAAAAKGKSDDASRRKQSAVAAMDGASMSEAEAEMNKESKNLEDCKKKLAEAREQLRRQLAEREEALKNLPKTDKPIDEIKADVKRLEGEVRLAASRLRSYRHSSVDADGGVYYLTTPLPKLAPPPPAPAPVPPPPPPPKSGARMAVAAGGILPLGLAVAAILVGTA